MTVDDRPVLVGVDGSECALAAVRWAAVEADRRRAPLQLLLVFTWTEEYLVGHPVLGARYRETMLAAARRDLETAHRSAVDAVPGLTVRHELEAGFPIGALAAAAADAQLLVLGHRGRGRVGGALLGSVAQALAAHAACPVVVVRGEADGTVPMEGPVAVGVDGSPTSEAALAFAFETAADRAVPLVAVHAWSDAIVDPLVVELVDRQELETAERIVLAERLAGWAEKFPDVPVRRVVVLDRPAHALIEAARGAQLLVVGSRGRGSVRGLLLGSVGHAVLHRSPCPVAVVRSVPRSAEEVPS